MLSNRNWINQVQLKQPGLLQCIALAGAKLLYTQLTTCHMLHHRYMGIVNRSNGTDECVVAVQVVAASQSH